MTHRSVILLLFVTHIYCLDYFIHIIHKGADQFCSFVSSMILPTSTFGYMKF